MILLAGYAREKLEIVLSASAFWRGGRKGGVRGGIPPAEPVNKISLDFFKYTSPVRRMSFVGLLGAKAHQLFFRQISRRFEFSKAKRDFFFSKIEKMIN